MRVPNFFIIGAPKCGTTSLAAWLAEHPQIYMSPLKEPYYFCKDINHNGIKSWKQYIRLFQRATEAHRVIGEASVYYLFSRTAVPLIERSLPGSRYIVMIRNPVKMARSLHGHYVRNGREIISDFRLAWEAALAQKQSRIVSKLCPDPKLLDYPSWCLLGEQLERLYAVVPKQRVLVLYLEDVIQNPRREYLKVLDFLGVRDDGRQDFPAYNVTPQYRSERVQRWFFGPLRRTISWVKRVGLLPAKSLGIMRRLQSLNERPRYRYQWEDTFKRRLQEFFYEDIQRLERLLGRNLNEWKPQNIARIIADKH